MPRRRLANKDRLHLEGQAPCPDQLQNIVDGQALELPREPLQVFPRKSQESQSRPAPRLLDVDKCASELDEAFIEKVFGPASFGQPKLFKHFVRLEKELLVEALKESQVMSIEGAVGDRGN